MILASAVPEMLPKSLKWVTWPWPHLFRDILSSLFDNCHITHSRDMVGAHQILYYMVHVTWPCPFQGWFVILGLILATVNLPTKFEVCMSVQWLEHWTCNQQVVGSNPTRGKKLHNNLGQVVNNYMPLSSNSITWYRPRGGDALRLGRYCRPGGKWWQSTTAWMTYSHPQADCLYTGISSGPNTR